MKTFLFFLFLLISIIIHCAPNMPEFEKVTNDKLRVISVKFEPGPDVRPGDTISALVKFAGDSLVKTDNFAISFRKISGNLLPEQTPLDIADLKTWFPDSMKLSFVIPDTIFTQYANYNGISRETALAVQQFSQSRKNEKFFSSAEIDTNMLINISQKLFAESNISFISSSKNGSSLPIRAEFQVNYNSCFPELKSLNNNPDISRLTLYIVDEDSLNTFDPNNPAYSGRFSKLPLYDRGKDLVFYTDTIEAQANKSYFLFVEVTGIDKYLNNLGSLESEQFLYTYFYSIHNDVQQGSDSIVVSPSPQSHWAHLNLSSIHGLQTLDVWTVVRDYANDAIRAHGVDTKHIRMVVKGR